MKNYVLEILKHRKHMAHDWGLTPAVILNDGTEISIQASGTHYCTPREYVPAEEYVSVEVGYPSKVIEELKEYAEDPREWDDEMENRIGDLNYTDTVYGWVPVEGSVFLLLVLITFPANRVLHITLLFGVGTNLFWSYLQVIKQTCRKLLAWDPPCPK
jgi:hypothetical protein